MPLVAFQKLLVLEVLGPVLHERGVDVCLALLQRRPKDNNPKELAMLSDVLKLICALAAHRKFAALLVDRGGVQQLLATPRVPQTLTGISLCLFAFASLQVSEQSQIDSDFLAFQPHDFCLALIF